MGALGFVVPRVRSVAVCFSLVFLGLLLCVFTSVFYLSVVSSSVIVWVFLFDISVHALTDGMKRMVCQVKLG